MSLSNLNNDDTQLVIRGTHTILTANGSNELLPIERATLNALKLHMLSQQSTSESLDSPSSRSTAPNSEELADLASRLDSDTIEALTSIWCLMPMVGGELSTTKSAVLTTLLAPLGKNVTLANDLLALSERDRLAPKFRIFKRLFPPMFHIGLFRGASQLLGSYLGVSERKMKRRYDALAELDPSTFGFQLWDFYQQNKLKPPGRFGAYPYMQIGPHDAHHVLAACDTSFQGEFLVAAFEAGSTRASTSDFLVSVMLQLQAGIVLDPSAPATQGLFDPDRFFREYARGIRVAQDLLAEQWDFWELTERPIAEVRSLLNIDRGGNVNWSEPVWNGTGSVPNTERTPASGHHTTDPTLNSMSN